MPAAAILLVFLLQHLPRGWDGKTAAHFLVWERSLPHLLCVTHVKVAEHRCVMRSCVVCCVGVRWPKHVSVSRGESQTAVTERQAHLKLPEKFATVVVISTKGCSNWKCNSFFSKNQPDISARRNFWYLPFDSNSFTITCLYPLEWQE